MTRVLFASSTIAAALLLLGGCSHRATQLVFRDTHSLVIGGKTQACLVEIRSDPEEPPLGDPNDETGLLMTCDRWRVPFTRELNSCLVLKSGIQIRWLENENSVIMQLQSIPDHGGSPTTYLSFNFATKRLMSNLYGLPSGERCYGDCYQMLAEKAAAVGIARKVQ